jgi:signal transduction histidine kinase
MDVSWLSKKIVTEDYAIKEKIKDILALLDNTVKTVRKIATELRPSILDDLGLREAMEWQSQEFQKRSGIEIVFSSSLPVINANGTISIGLFRIYQESLTNVARHAGASVVTTTLEEKDNQLILSITDNGKGFDINTSSSKKTLGLLGMKERTLMMGGEYEIISTPGKGARVIVSVPYIQTDSAK